MKKSKLITILLVLLMAAFAAVGFAGCEKDNGGRRPGGSDDDDDSVFGGLSAAGKAVQTSMEQMYSTDANGKAYFKHEDAGSKIADIQNDFYALPVEEQELLQDKLDKLLQTRADFKILETWLMEVEAIAVEVTLNWDEPDIGQKTAIQKAIDNYDKLTDEQKSLGKGIAREDADEWLEILQAWKAMLE